MCLRFSSNACWCCSSCSYKCHSYAMDTTWKMLFNLEWIALHADADAHSKMAFCLWRTHKMRETKNLLIYCSDTGSYDLSFLVNMDSLQVDINSFRNETSTETKRNQNQNQCAPNTKSNSNSISRSNSGNAEWQNGNERNGKINSTAFMSVYLSQLLLFIILICIFFPAFTLSLSILLFVLSFGHWERCHRF